MVKVTNSAGDKYKGKIGNQQYQGYYDVSLRKKESSPNKPATDKQKESRQKFKDAVKWAKTLPYSDKMALKQLYKINFPSYQPGQPVNWYNYAKSIYITTPTFQIVDAETSEYKVEHPAIYCINEYNSDDNILRSACSLSSLDDCVVTGNYRSFPPVGTTRIKVTTLPGLEYSFEVPEVISGLIYCDIMYCNPMYCM